VLGRPLLAGCVRAALLDGRVEADLLRVDGRVVVPVSNGGATVATLWPGSRTARPAGGPPTVRGLDLGAPPEDAGSVVPVEMVEPDPATMDLGDATRVIGGGAGLVREGSSDEEAGAVFALLSDVAAALGASAGATRVVTDAGWMGYDRQIGTTGVTLHPELYVALGVSGATQHTGGLGDPQHVVSVNLDASCPMTGLADLGLVGDAPALLLELADRLGVDIPEVLKTRSVQQ
jgi:electron transfer flavoprotein alpha subunit